MDAARIRNPPPLLPPAPAPPPLPPLLAGRWLRATSLALTLAAARGDEEPAEPSEEAECGKGDRRVWLGWGLEWLVDWCT